MNKRFFACFVSLAMVAGMSSVTTVFAADFALNSVSTDRADDYVPTAITTKMSVKADNATGVTYSWSVDNTDIATIDSTGTLTPKKAGTINVTVSANGQSKSCEVKVTDCTFNVVPDYTAVLPGAKRTIKAVIKMKDVSSDHDITLDNGLITWSLDNTLAALDKGTLTAGSSTGTVTVKAVLTANPTFTASTPISITNNYIVVSIPNSDTVSDIIASTTPKLNAKFYTTDTGKNKTITWTTDAKKASLKPMNNADTPADESNVQVSFLDSGAVTVRAYLSNDKNIFTDYKFNVTISKDQLENDIYNATSYEDNPKYTTANWNNLQLAIKEAQKIDDSDNVTQAQINKADANLLKAIANLTKSDTAKTTGEESNADTGDCTPIAAAGSVMVLALGALLIIKKTKK